MKNNKSVITKNLQFISDNKCKKILAMLPLKGFENNLEELQKLEFLKLYNENKKGKTPAINKRNALKMIEAKC